MNKIFISLLTLCCFIVLNSCSNGSDDNADQEPVAIELTGGSQASISSVSRSSIGSFPNNGRIGVTAAYYDATPDNISWTSYPDITDMGATAVLGSGNSYTFTWDTPKYWPFDNRQLVFMAYSPPIVETNDSLILSSDKAHIYIKLYEGMPDFMYATANVNAKATPYSKSPLQVVNLGEFQHALSKLTVEVVADPTMNPAVKLNNLSVKTDKRISGFDLSTNTLSEPVDGEYIYNLVSQITALAPTDTVRHSVLLFPGTEDVTLISIGLIDSGGLYVSNDFMMSFFQNTTNVGSPLSLERGVNTTLRLIVKGTTITNVEIELKGVLSDWNEQGNFGITIN